MGGHGAIEEVVRRLIVAGQELEPGRELHRLDGRAGAGREGLEEIAGPPELAGLIEQPGVRHPNGIGGGRSRRGPFRQGEFAKQIGSAPRVLSPRLGEQGADAQNPGEHRRPESAPHGPPPRSSPIRQLSNVSIEHEQWTDRPGLGRTGRPLR